MGFIRSLMTDRFHTERTNINLSCLVGNVSRVGKLEEEAFWTILGQEESQQKAGLKALRFC